MSALSDICILISAGAEWRGLLPAFPEAQIEPTPYGDSFESVIDGHNLRFLRGGWGKVSAAGSTQYAIDRWSPSRIINLGTCGGFKGQVSRGEIILVKKTIIYDLIEQMAGQDRAIAHYAVDFDLSWLPVPSPQPVTVGTLLSADRDIVPSEISGLIGKFNAKVADWESGAIAWVAMKNNLPCMILRGVSDLVDLNGGEAYSDYAFFEKQAKVIMESIAAHLPAWIEAFSTAK